MCTLKQPDIKSDVTLPESLENIIAFILHGVTHMLDDGRDIPLTFFAEKEDTMAVIDTRQLPSVAVAPQAVNTFIEQNSDVISVSSLCEAWTLPEDRLKEQKKGISGYDSIGDHPDKYEVVVIMVESYDGIWIGQAPVGPAGTKRELPDVITFKKLSEQEVIEEQITTFLPPKMPSGVMFH